MGALRVGIVGGAGQVGAALLRKLNGDSQFSAFGICRSSVSAARIAAQGMQVRVVNTDDAGELTETTRDLDAIVNCALPQYPTSKASAANRTLASSLVAASTGKHLVHLSSVAVYGDFIACSEELFDRPRPNTGYGCQKLQMEQLLHKLSKMHHIKCTILRVGHVYGPELRWSESFFDLLKKDGFSLPFDGDLPSNAIWIKNLIAGIQEVLIRKPLQDTFNLVDAPQTTWRTIFDLHSQASGNPTVLPLNQSESRRCALHAKVKRNTGLSLRLLLETLAWIKHLPASYIASAPAFKAILQRGVAKIGSERLDARLWALYFRHFAPPIQADYGSTIPPMFLSEPVPGPCLSYRVSPPAECLAALEIWHDAISTPEVNARGAILYPKEFANRIP